MGKLSSEQIDEYFDIHLPYRTGVLLKHYKMRHDADGKFIPWTGDPVVLNACFVAALVTARLYLNLFWIGKKGGRLANLLSPDVKADDVTVDDLGGRRVEVSTILPQDQVMLFDFIVMADKAAAHFTIPKSHDRRPIPDVILMIHGYLKTHLYDAAGRAGLEAV